MTVDVTVRRSDMSDIRAVLREIEDQEGRLDPETVLKRAKTHPVLAKYITWDTKLAAHAWQLQQVEKLIRRVYVITTVQDREIHIPAYVHNPDLGDEVKGYVSTAVIRNDWDRARKALLAELKQVIGICERAMHLAEYLGEIQAITTIALHAQEAKVKIEQLVGA